MTPTNTIKQVRVFVGLVKYYRYMWGKWSHLLQPLTALTSTKVTSKWTDVEQQAIDKIKQIVACDTLLIYPDFNKGFDIHTDDSGFQLGALIIQDGKPIALYIHKLIVPQLEYTVTEK